MMASVALLNGRFLVLLICLAWSSVSALAEQRVALVVGNSSYRNTAQLRNSSNDAQDIASGLQKFGFEVIQGLDLDKAALEAKLRQFAQALKGADAGVFFYAGHGLQVGGQNFLIPIDAKLDDVSNLDFETIRLDVVQRIMEREAKTRILFLDACRDNPLARSLARSMGTRSVEVQRGLAPIESGVGTLISFSTQPGNVALDGEGRNSPFAGALAKHLASSNDDLSAILIAVRNEVMQITNNRQVPWEHSSLRARFYFALPSVGVEIGQEAKSEAGQRWSEIKDSDDVALLTAFRGQYGAASPFYDHLPRNRLEVLAEKPADNKPGADSKLTYHAAELFAEVFNRIRANYPEKPDEMALLSRASIRLLDKFPGIFERTDLDTKIGGLDQSQPNQVPVLLAETFGHILKQYGRTAEAEVLLESMLNLVLRGLDAQTNYLRPERYRDFLAVTKGEFGGVGLELRSENGLIKVVGPIADTPAANADLYPGDLITQIDSKPINGLTLEQVVGRLRGPVKTPVTVTILRKGTERPREINLVRDLIRVSPVKARLESDVIYIKLSTFNEQSRPNLRQSLQNLKKSAGERLRGYVLDLRNNSGGLLNAATLIAGDFLDGRPIVTIKGRAKDAVDRRVAQPGDIADNKPMVVLVNGGTGSGAEIVAAALQDHRRALVIGTRSLGKGSIQTIYPLGERGALRLTTEYMYRPSGKALETVGVFPDVVIEQDAAGSGRDGPFEAAIARMHAGEPAAKPELNRRDAEPEGQRVANLVANEHVASEVPKSPAAMARPGGTFRDCDQCPEMVVVPAGSFMMGSPENEAERESLLKGSETPQHRVTIDRPFAVSRFTVMRDQFQIFVDKTGHSVGDKCWTYEKDKWEERGGRSFRNPGFAQDGSHPVVCVNWEDANAYVTWLSSITGRTYRLLTEAQREYAARAGTTTPFWWGVSISGSEANYDASYTYGGGPKGKWWKKTLPANSFTPNPWGFYNVHGNVWDWVQDCWNAGYDGAPTDGTAWATGECARRVVRGGSWFNIPRVLRSAFREAYFAVNRYSIVGFRVGRAL
jgi:carboxyl-terminal processing protease